MNTIATAEQISKKLLEFKSQDSDITESELLELANFLEGSISTSLLKVFDEFDLRLFIECEKNERAHELLKKLLLETFPQYNVGEAVIYQNGNKFELGIVKTECGNNEYFINYHTGDTAARTHARHLHKISNNYAFHVIRLDTEDNERR